MNVAVPREYHGNAVFGELFGEIPAVCEEVVFSYDAEHRRGGDKRVMGGEKDLFAVGFGAGDLLIYPFVFRVGIAAGLTFFRGFEVVVHREKPPVVVEIVCIREGVFVDGNGVVSPVRRVKRAQILSFETGDVSFGFAFFVVSGGVAYVFGLALIYAEASVLSVFIVVSGGESEYFKTFSGVFLENFDKILVTYDLAVSGEVAGQKHGMTFLVGEHRVEGFAQDLFRFAELHLVVHSRNGIGIALPVAPGIIMQIGHYVKFHKTPSRKFCGQTALFYIISYLSRAHKRNSLYKFPKKL